MLMLCKPPHISGVKLGCTEVHISVSCSNVSTHYNVCFERNLEFIKKNHLKNLHFTMNIAYKNEPTHKKTNNLHMRKQSRRSAMQ